MAGVTFSLVDYVSRGPIQDLPIVPGAKWAAQLNRADALSCTINLRDPDALTLDLRSSTEPKKTVMLARTDDDVILAWGIVDKDRVWDEDARTLSITATGVEKSIFGASIIGPASALTAPLMVRSDEGPMIPNPALDTDIVGYSLGSIGKKLVEQRLAWPGSPAWILQASEFADNEAHYLFTDYKTVGAALSALSDRENGPDFIFEARRSSGGLLLEYVMRHGTTANPSVGTEFGSWGLGGESPVTGLTVSDSADDIATAVWMSGGRTTGETILSRAQNPGMITSGFPPLDLVEKGHSTVVLQSTLDSYARRYATYASRSVRSLSFSVKGDAAPRLGQYRPGDTGALDVPSDHPWLLEGSIPFRLTSISGDETGKTIQIGCEAL